MHRASSAGGKAAFQQQGVSEFAGSFLAGGSSQTASTGASIIAAQRELVKQLLELAREDSPLHGLKPDEVASCQGALYKMNDPARFENYATTTLARAHRSEVIAEANASEPLEMMHWSMHSFGAMFAEVKVNVITGETRVSRFPWGV